MIERDVPVGHLMIFDQLPLGKVMLPSTHLSKVWFPVQNRGDVSRLVLGDIVVVDSFLVS
jgi:hypothetical protein